MKNVIALMILTLATILFIGCGSSSNKNNDSGTSSSESMMSSSSSSLSSNLGEPLNSEGYYGDKVQFGGILLVGEWGLGENFQTRYKFYADGSGENANFSGVYGLDENGSLLSTTIYGITYFLFKSKDENSSNCLYVDFEPSWELGTTPPVYSSKMCKLDSKPSYKK